MDSCNKKRIDYIDVARGISILLMIVGHVIEPGWKRNLIFSYHMPFFIIISGFFHKDKSKVFKKLILPYIIWTLIVSLLFCDGFSNIPSQILNWIKQIVFSYSYYDKFQFTAIVGEIINIPTLGVLWFLPLLALTKYLFALYKKICKDDNQLLIAFCIITSYIGYVLSINGIWLPFSFDVVLTSLVFYLSGYWLSKENNLQRIFSNWKLLVIILIVWIVGIKYSSIELAVRSYPGGFYSFIVAFCGTIIILKVSSLIEKHFKNITKILSWYGKNSMYILLFHYFEMFYNKEYELLFLDQNITIKKLKIILLKFLIVTIGTIFLLELEKLIRKFSKKQIKK